MIASDIARGKLVKREVCLLQLSRRTANHPWQCWCWECTDRLLSQYFRDRTQLTHMARVMIARALDEANRG